MRTIKFTKVGNPFCIMIFVLIFAGFAFTAIYWKSINRGIDFDPGVTVQFTVKSEDKTADIATIRNMFEPYNVQLQEVDNGDLTLFEYRIRFQQVDLIDNMKVEDMNELQKLAYEAKISDLNFDNVVEQKIISMLTEKFSQNSVDIRSVQSVSPSHANLLTTSFIWLVLAVFLLIMIYIWIRFKFAFAIAAIVSSAHDVLFMCAFIGVFHIEITASTIAAILTILGYSLNDTIVIFDRIRENLKDNIDNLSLKEIIDKSITQSLSRTVVTALTTLFTVLCLYVFATGEIKNFALNLLVGVVAGTWSSIFIASPVFMMVTNLIKRRTEKRELKKYGTKVVDKKIATGEISVVNNEVVIPKVERKLRRKKK